MKNTFLLIIILAALVLLGIWFFGQNDENGDLDPSVDPVNEEQQLTEEVALGLLADDLPTECAEEGVEGGYASCDVDLDEEGGTWFVSVTYEGLRDDSVRASRHEAAVTFVDNAWVTSEVSNTYACHEGRGQEDFAPELCI